MKNLLIKNKNTHKGFTLIEILVATSLFAVVAVGGLSILLSSQKIYKRISNNRVAVDNINLVIDTMEREVRFGSEYGCVNTSIEGSFSRQNNTNFNSFSPSFLTSNSSGMCNAVAFTPQSSPNTKIVYYFDTASSTINQAGYNMLGGNYILDPSQNYPLTSSDFVVNNFWMKVSGVSKEDYLQPKVDFFASGVITTLKNKKGETSTSDFTVQATAVQRILDN